MGNTMEPVVEKNGQILDILKYGPIPLTENPVSFY